MIKVISIPTTEVSITDDAGVELLRCSVLELHYLTLAALEGDVAKTKKEQGVAIAAAIKTEYNVEVSWAAALHLALQVQQELGAEKKSQSDSQDS